MTYLTLIYIALFLGQNAGTAVLQDADPIPTPTSSNNAHVFGSLKSKDVGAPLANWFTEDGGNRATQFGDVATIPMSTGPETFPTEPAAATAPSEVTTSTTLSQLTTSTTLTRLPTQASTVVTSIADISTTSKISMETTEKVDASSPQTNSQPRSTNTVITALQFTLLLTLYVIAFDP